MPVSLWTMEKGRYEIVAKDKLRLSLDASMAGDFFLSELINQEN